MALNTSTNIGHRKDFAGMGMRNFENNGTTLYTAVREPTVFLGTTYHKGDSLTFDTAGTSYSKKALAELALLWNSDCIKPAV